MRMKEFSECLSLTPLQSRNTSSSWSKNAAANKPPPSSLRTTKYHIETAPHLTALIRQKTNPLPLYQPLASQDQSYKLPPIPSLISTTSSSPTLKPFGEVAWRLEYLVRKAYSGDMGSCIQTITQKQKTQILRMRWKKPRADIQCSDLSTQKPRIPPYPFPSHLLGKRCGNFSVSSFLVEVLKLNIAMKG